MQNYKKTNKKYMNHYEKDKESSFLMYWDANNYMDGNVSLANNFGLENIKF